MPLGSHNRNIGEVLGAVYRFVLEPPPWSLEESSFDLTTGAQYVTQRRIFAGGHTEERTLTRYHYILTEPIKLCDAAGLTVRDVYGDWQLAPYTPYSREPENDARHQKGSLKCRNSPSSTTL